MRRPILPDFRKPDRYKASSYCGCNFKMPACYDTAILKVKLLGVEKLFNVSPENVICNEDA